MRECEDASKCVWLCVRLCARVHLCGTFLPPGEPAFQDFSPALEARPKSTHPVQASLTLASEIQIWGET